MALTDRYPSSIVITNKTPDNGTWYVMDEVGNSSPDSWDTLTVKMCCIGASEVYAEDAAQLYAIGDQITGGRLFYFQGISNFKCHGDYVYTANFIFKGLASTKPTVVEYDAAANEQSGKNILFDGNIYENFATHENTPSATVRYIATVDSSLTANVGTAQTPPSAPDVVASGWTFLTKYTYHYPNGWVLMATKVTPLPGTDLGLVADRYQYIRDITPAG